MRLHFAIRPLRISIEELAAATRIFRLYGREMMLFRLACIYEQSHLREQLRALE